MSHGLRKNDMFRAATRPYIASTRGIDSGSSRFSMNVIRKRVNEKLIRTREAGASSASAVALVSDELPPSVRRRAPVTTLSFPTLENAADARNVGAAFADSGFGTEKTTWPLAVELPEREGGSTARFSSASGVRKMEFSSNTL